MRPDPPTFVDGLAPKADGGKFGYIDPEGHFIIPPTFMQAEPFREGFAIVRTSARSRWTYITTTGAPAFKAKFAQAEPFSDGLARVLVEVES